MVKIKKCYVDDNVVKRIEIISLGELSFENGSKEAFDVDILSIISITDLLIELVMLLVLMLYFSDINEYMRFIDLLLIIFSLCVNA